MTSAVSREAGDDLLAGGDLEGSIARLAAQVRSEPGDEQTRMFLFQLLCVTADWTRALAQLRALAALSPEAKMLEVAYGGLIAAEEVRARAVAGQGEAPLLVGGNPWAGAFSSALGKGRAGEHLLADAPGSAGEADGHRFEYLFDGDSRFGPMVEAMVGGRWGLIPFEMIEEIRTPGPVDLRDLVWLPADIRLRGGGALAAFLPVRYPGTEREAGSALRLARMTEWRDRDGAVHGVGQRMWTLSDGEDVPILGFRRIRLDGPE